MKLRLATFNLENFGDGPKVKPPLNDRIAIMRPQLQRIAADIICFQEVNSQIIGGEKTTGALDQLLNNTAYAGYSRAITKTMGNECYDERNLVTLSKFGILNEELIRDAAGPRPSYRMACSDPPDPAAKPLEWERPMLCTQIDLGSGNTLHLINVHLKSKLASGIPGQKIDSYTWKTASAWAEGSFISSMKRLGQALQARMLIDRIFDGAGPDALIAIVGDFNSQAEEFPIQAICGPVEETGNPDHAARMMIPCENNIPDSARYSLIHLGKGQMLDHIIVSRAFFRYFTGAEIHNEALPDESGAFRDDTKFPESDHAPVIAKFDME